MGIRACATGGSFQEKTCMAIKNGDEYMIQAKRDVALPGSARIARMMLAGVMVCLLWESIGAGCALLRGRNLSSGSNLCRMSERSTSATWFLKDALIDTTPSGTVTNSGSSVRQANQQIREESFPNYAASWRQWAHTKLRSHASEEHTEMLPDELSLSSLGIANVAKLVYGSGVDCGGGTPGAAMVDVESSSNGKMYGMVACPMFWNCTNPKRAPSKLSAICWDPKFHDLPVPASLPTEDRKSFITPRFGETTVDMNYEFRGTALFMHNVYANGRSQVFDSQHLFLKGGCGEKVEDVYLKHRTTVSRHEIVINLAHSLAHSQYHGLIELLTRLVILLPLIQALPEVPVLMTTRDAPHIEEMLRLVGISSGLDHINVSYIRRYYSSKLNTTAELVYANTMILAHNPECGCTSGSVWDFIRQHYFRIPYSRETPLNKDQPWSVVLAERTKSRAIVQHKELLAGLISLLGDDKVKVFSDSVKWSKQEQKDYFSDAAIFIASHGAGLSNMVFMPFHSSIIEVRPLNFSNPCYHSTADMLRFSYYRIDSPGVKSSNLTVDVDSVLSLVSAIVGARGHSVPSFYRTL